MTVSIGYDTRCYFNVYSKADMSQLNLPHRIKLESGVKEKRKSKERICSEVSVNSPGNPWSQSWKAVVGRICRRGSFQAWSERVKGGGSFATAGPGIWNGFSDEVTSATSLLTFRRKLKAHLFRQSVFFYLGHCFTVYNVM